MCLSPAIPASPRGISVVDDEVDGPQCQFNYMKTGEDRREFITGSGLPTTHIVETSHLRTTFTCTSNPDVCPACPLRSREHLGAGHQGSLGGFSPTLGGFLPAYRPLPFCLDLLRDGVLFLDTYTRACRCRTGPHTGLLIRSLVDRHQLCPGPRLGRNGSGTTEPLLLEPG